MNPNFDTHVKTKGSAKLYAKADGSKVIGYLLWGDGVKFLADAPTATRRRVKARGRSGWVDKSALGGKSLLELYFIDVGQGDGVLVKTPDFRHLVIDAGHPRAKQPSRKSGADFVDWKFVKDYGGTAIELDALIASHNDLDHYGGLDDLLDAQQNAELDAQTVAVERFFHAGLSWWRGAGGRTLGPTATKGARKYFVDLLNDRASAVAALDGASKPQLQGEWREFVKQVVAAKTRGGQPTPFTRLSEKMSHLPGFEPGSATPVIRVLAPLETTVQNAAGQNVPGLQDFGEPSQSTNGQSILLRIDYGRARILLTGDLNKAAQQALLEAHAGHLIDFQCDVAKACHHGSDDVSFAFLQAMNASATIISSGDAEGHDHPRPRVVAASGLTGYMTVKDDQIVTPLVYSTELARSTLLGDMVSIDLANGTKLNAAALKGSKINYVARKPGALNPSPGHRKFETTYVVAGVVYGLVNVRTDGDTILCATMNEGDGSWSFKTFKSRF